MSPRPPRKACLHEGCRRRPLRWWVIDRLPLLPLGYCDVHEPGGSAAGTPAVWELEGPYSVRELQVRRVLSS